MTFAVPPPRRLPAPPPPAPSTPRRPASRRRARWHGSIAGLGIVVAVAAFTSLVWGEYALYEWAGLQHRPRPALAQPAETADPAALYLVRSTLLSLDDANQTGNYAVLRLLGSKSFQTANSAEDLARVFGTQRAAGLDLSVAALQSPRFAKAPHVGSDRLLRLAGSYDNSSGLLQFALAFAAEGGVWRLEAIHVAQAPLPERIATTAGSPEFTGR